MDFTSLVISISLGLDLVLLTKRATILRERGGEDLVSCLDFDYQPVTL